MTNKEKLNFLEEALDIEKDTLNEDTELSQISQWDSMAAITLIASFDEILGKTILPSDVKEFKYVIDIMNKID